MTQEITQKPKKKVRRMVKHGAFLTSKLIHASPVPGIGSMLRQAEGAIVEDLGGVEFLSGKEKLQTQNVLRLLHILYSLDFHLMREGVMDRGEVRACIPKYVEVIGTLSRVLQSLGLRREVREKLPTLKDYLEATISKVSDPVAEASEIVAQRAASEAVGGENV